MKAILNLFKLFLLGCCIQSCTFDGIQGNRQIIEKEITISDYYTIELSGAATLIYEQNKDKEVYFKIETDENIFPLIDIKSENGILSIGSKENIRPTKCNIYTNSSGLEKLNVSGAIDAHIKDKLIIDHLYIDISGGANIVADHIECHLIQTNVSGASNMTLTGTTNLLKCSSSGAGKVNAESLVADSVYCDSSGSGSFDVHAVTYLNASIAGIGNVSYKGDPKVEKSIAGIGKVSRKE